MLRTCATLLSCAHTAVSLKHGSDHVIKPQHADIQHKQSSDCGKAQLTKRVMTLCDGLNAAWICIFQLDQVINACISQALCQQVTNARQLTCQLSAVVPHAALQGFVQQQGVCCGCKAASMGKVSASSSSVIAWTGKCVRHAMLRDKV